MSRLCFSAGSIRASTGYVPVGPKGGHGFASRKTYAVTRVAYCLRYQAQTYAYLFLLTSRYPSLASSSGFQFEEA